MNTQPLANWPNDWAVFWVLICTVNLTVCSWHDSQMLLADKYSEHSSIVWPVWPIGWVFVYELSGSGFESCWINILQFVFIICQVKDYRIILKLSCSPFVLTLCKAFLKYKKRSGTSLPSSFSAWFLKKCFFFYILLPNPLSDGLYFLRYWAICVL